jgi:hypothetical protein
MIKDWSHFKTKNYFKTMIKALNKKRNLMARDQYSHKFVKFETNKIKCQSNQNTIYLFQN